MAEKKYAAILVRGIIGADRKIKDTLKMLNLNKRNKCVLVDCTKNMLGMLNKVKNYATYGEADEETLKLLREKSEAEHYNLNSPRKGYGKKGVKDDFSHGGALGYRGDKINDLIRRMV
jgi:large subunit ribosomal protein L30